MTNSAPHFETKDLHTSTHVLKVREASRLLQPSIKQISEVLRSQADNIAEELVICASGTVLTVAGVVPNADVMTQVVEIIESVLAKDGLVQVVNQMKVA